jgi:hypothetical protein
LELFIYSPNRSETVAMDATFIKAYSKRDSHDNRRGASDPNALVGRDGRTYGLGYKAHIAASANEKKHAPGLLDKAVAALRLGVPGKVRSIATFGW